MSRISKSLILILLTMFTMSSCFGLGNSESKVLNGTAWKLVSFDSRLPIPGSNMTLEFSENEVRGSASCNHYFGSYKIRGDEVSITGLGWTEMACLDPEGIMEQEQILMGLLSKAAGFNIAGNTLHITTSTGEVLTFEKSSMGE